MNTIAFLTWCPDTICLDPRLEAIRCEIIRLGGGEELAFRVRS